MGPLQINQGNVFVISEENISCTEIGQVLPPISVHQIDSSMGRVAVWKPEDASSNPAQVNECTYSGVSEFYISEIDQINSEMLFSRLFQSVKHVWLVTYALSQLLFILKNVGEEITL